MIDFATGWKADFIIAEDSEYGCTAMTRRVPITIAGITVYIASAEDVLIAKLRWAKLGGSARQLEDAAGVVTTQGSNLDYSYIEHWVCAFQLEEQWAALRRG